MENGEMYKVLICGSRDFTDYDKFCGILCGDGPFDYMSVAIDGREMQIISGGARGADALAKKFAEEMHQNYKNISYLEFRADWDKYGKRAGFIRNRRMLEEKPDVVIAFWDGVSKGTKNTIEEAEKLGIPCIIHRV